MSVISVKNLSKNYEVIKKEPGLLGSIKSLIKTVRQEVKAVKNINFSINKGEFVGLLGPNGAGKTTTLKVLSGLLHPTDGEAEVLGFTPWKRDNRYLKQISLVMGQKNQLWWDLPAYESFLVNKEIYGINDNDFKNRLEELSHLLEVSHLLKVQVRRLSLGERMKMELIAALLHNPKVLFLDEPTIGLDVVSQQTVRKFLKEYNRQSDNVILLTSHYINDIKELCDRVIIINKGSIVYDGSLDNIISATGDKKIITLTFGDRPSRSEIEKYGEIIAFEYGKAVLKVPKNLVSTICAKILNNFTVIDFKVEERPLEEVIATLFREGIGDFK